MFPGFGLVREAGYGLAMMARGLYLGTWESLVVLHHDHRPGIGLNRAGPSLFTN